MDSLVLMAMAMLAAMGWIIGCVRRRSQWWIRFGAGPGVGLMAYYFFLELTRSQPALVSVQPQAGYPVVAFMCLGVIAFLSKPKPPKTTNDHHDDTGGALSA